MTSGEAIAWLRDYAAAWERGDNGVVELFTPDATYRSGIFRDAHSGHDGIGAYWRAATSTQADARVLVGDALVDGERVVAEWSTAMTDDGEPATLPGVLLLDFAGDRCRALREYWAHETGRHDPYAGWGRFAGGDAARHADAWAEAYARAWRAGDAGAAARLYAQDVVFRSHPFREPQHGPAEVRAYTASAFTSEGDRVVRFGRPVAEDGGAAVEYWTTYTEDGTPQTLAGCVLMSFDASGTVSESRDYWHVIGGTFEPPAGWGWRT